MAMGTKLNDVIPFISEVTAKLSLTIFRIIAILGLAYWWYDTFRKQVHPLLRWALCLILAGALGNIIDSIFTDNCSLTAMDKSPNGQVVVKAMHPSFWTRGRYAAISLSGVDMA